MKLIGIRFRVGLYALPLAVVLALASACAKESTGDAPQGPRVVVPAAEGIYLGVFSAGVEFDDDAYEKYSQQAGAAPSIIATFETWSNTPPLDKLRHIASHDAVPLVAWEPWNGPNREATDLDGLFSGRYDGYIESWANALASLRSPVLIRLGHEMNGDWFPWSGANNGGGALDGYGTDRRADGPERFVAFWRYVHDIFTEAGAVNVSWLWSPNPNSVPDESWNQPLEYYPGDAYVDWVGVSVFNFGDRTDAKPWATWRPFSDIVGGPYHLFEPLGKPMIIPEVGSVEGSGNKGNWIREMAIEIRLSFPLIKGIVWFDENDPELGDFSLDTSPDSMAAWREVSREPFYAVAPTYEEIDGASE
ncbi:MAG: glycosyl hydrolase [Dehalococcoidia bacterium]